MVAVAVADAVVVVVVGVAFGVFEQWPAQDAAVWRCFWVESRRRRYWLWPSLVVGVVVAARRHDAVVCTALQHDAQEPSACASCWWCEHEE